MYKVFVDEIEIRFLKTEELSTKFGRVSKDEFKDILEADKSVKDMINDQVLQVICHDLDQDFEEVFQHHTFLEAAGGIVKKENKLLIIKRKGIWDLPKGKIEKGERPEEAASREIQEECGIGHPYVQSLISKTFHVYRFKGNNFLKKTWWFYLTYDGPFDTSPQIEEGITEVKWIEAAELDTIRSNTYRSIDTLIDDFKEMDL